jgi:hypothetical protein
MIIVEDYSLAGLYVSLASVSSPFLLDTAASYSGRLGFGSNPYGGYCFSLFLRPLQAKSSGISLKGSDDCLLSIASKS